MAAPNQTIFITGTDTGVGKSLLTALLLNHLRKSGVRALAMKPFCSGGREDVELLQALQPGELPDSMANPFYFEEPVAPLVAARNHGRRIQLTEVVARITEVGAHCDYLLIEGAGGLLVPLGESYGIVDLIGEIACQVIVVAANRLGTLNHTQLTVRVLEQFKRPPSAVVLMDVAQPDFSSKTNPELLAELLPNLEIIQLAYLKGEKRNLDLVRLYENQLDSPLNRVKNAISA